MLNYCRRSLVVLLLLVLTGCDGDDNPTGGGTVNLPPGNDTITATVDGNAWSAIQVAAINNGGVVAISGSDASLLAISFAFAGTTPGTFTIGASSVANANVIDNLSGLWSANGEQGSGTITVTTLTSTAASGTFSYSAPRQTATTGPETRVVTNGVFSVTF